MCDQLLIWNALHFQWAALTEIRDEQPKTFSGDEEKLAAKLQEMALRIFPPSCQQSDDFSRPETTLPERKNQQP